jgi:Arc/MetJ-type ribon-helix-helix transcriptional regulator
MTVRISINITCVIYYFMPKKLKRTTVLLTPEQMDEVDQLVKDGTYPSFSEAVRTAVRNLLVKGK